MSGVLSLAVAAGAYAAHGGGGGGSMSGGGHEGGGEASVLKKPLNKKKEFSCFQYLLARSQTDAVCRILFDATQERGDVSGLKEVRHDKLREKLLGTRNGLRYMRALPDAGPSTPPNWCELKRLITGVDEIIRLEKKREDDRKAEEAEAKKKD